MAYLEAPERVIELVKETIKQYHPWLKPFSVAVIMKDKATISNGKVIRGTAQKFPEKLKPLMDREYHFLITLAFDEWETLDPLQKRALIDHELLHCQIDGDLQPAMRAHDFEVFAEEIERHGFWHSDLRVMANAVQGRLEFGDDWGGFVGTMAEKINGLREIGAVLETA